MKRALAALFWVFAALPVHGDLEGFRDQVEQTEQAKPTEQSPASDQPGHQKNDLGDAVFSLLTLLWAADNLYTTYGDFPYAESSFVQWPEWRETTRGMVPVPRPGSNSWFAVESQAFLLDGLGTGAGFDFQGHFYRFLGPAIEAWSLSDGRTSLSGARLGAQFSLVQADPFSLAVYLQYLAWVGVLDRQGAALGVRFRTFPAKPWVIEARAGAQIFSSFTLGELEVQAGYLFDRWEVLAGWRSWSLGEGTGTAPPYHGPFVATRYWF